MNIKRLFSWQVIMGIVLIALSALVYYIHYLIFRDAHHIFLYLIGDIAFVFIEVLLVTLVLHGLLSYREKKALLKKLNMVIGAFFSEVGTELIKIISKFDSDAVGISKNLIVTKAWSDKEFSKMKVRAFRYRGKIELDRSDLEALKDFLVKKRIFLLTLLENPNLLEHETFTNLLWAVFHLTEELLGRKSLKNLHEKDREHLVGDINRAYTHVVVEWLSYMNHLSRDYPYLFSLAMRTNPFDTDASVEIK